MQATIIVIHGNSDDSAGTMNKKCTQMLVAFFLHIHQHLPVSTRVLSWNQTQPCGKVTTIFKLYTDQTRRNIRHPSGVILFGWYVLNKPAYQPDLTRRAERHF